MDWSYIAGYFDGEGTALCSEHSAKNHSLRIVVSWANTHRGSLEEMREFMGVGRIVTRKRPPNKDIYDLIISDHAGFLIAVPHLLEHCIIKRPALLKIAERLPLMRPRHSGWGALARAGDEEIRRLYWDEHQTFDSISATFGVSPSAVKAYMKRHAIPVRTRGQAAREGIARRTERWQERNRKISEARKADWQDPEYRERMIAAVTRNR